LQGAHHGIERGLSPLVPCSFAEINGFYILSLINDRLVILLKKFLRSDFVLAQTLSDKEALFVLVA
jgi:hypothetical protein